MMARREFGATSGRLSDVVHVILISYLVRTIVLAAPPSPVKHGSETQPAVGGGSGDAKQTIDVNKLREAQSKPPAGQLAGRDGHTADLVPLINETLKTLNNRTGGATRDERPGGAHAAGPHKQTFRDDWTFDRVEYDLIEFLQELNARYQANTTAVAAAAASDAASLDERRDQQVSQATVGEEPQVARKTISADCARNDALETKATAKTTTKKTSLQTTTTTNSELVTKSTIEQVKKELDLVAPKVPLAGQAAPLADQGERPAPSEGPRDTQSASTASSAPSAPATLGASSELPISLASGDQDISESTWQYGIFDRFTRPRASTTSAPTPAESLAASATNSNLDVRSFNSDECGLRTYRQEPDYFPALGGGSGGSPLDTDEISKELSQRRQRPPLGGSFFSSHKKYHLTSAGGEGAPRDELEPAAHKQTDAPPYDRYGEPAAVRNPGPAGPAEPKYPAEKGQLGAGVGAVALGLDSDPMSPAGDGEFNLALRRQWLQQQLGSTLQVLGYNGTSSSAALASAPSSLEAAVAGANGAHQSLGDLFNQSSYGMRENMMKMSGGGGNNNGGALVNKLARSLEGGPMLMNERELKARQDELKLEARVIGGNDARLGDSPWSASLQALVSRPGTGGVEYRHYCGGTIISEHYILTAAHCLDFMVGRESRLFVVIGDLNWRMSAASLHGRRFGIEKLIIHGGYKSTAFGHDIGLIRTKESMRPLKVNGRYIINSVCLPERNVEHSGEAELVGWGLFSNRNEMADSLQIADVPILPRPLCVDLYRRRTGLIQWLIGIELITEKQVCAGTFGRGICQGDSGSALVYNEKVPALERRADESSTLAAAAAAPAAIDAVDQGPPPSQRAETQPDGKADIRRLLRSQVVRDQQQRATIIGTVAFGGIRRCSYQSLPGVYMQTSKYLDWILPRIQA